MLLAFVFTFSTLHKPQFASTFQTFLVSYKTKFLAQIATTILKISLAKNTKFDSTDEENPNVTECFPSTRSYFMTEHILSSTCKLC